MEIVGITTAASEARLTGAVAASGEVSNVTLERIRRSEATKPIGLDVRLLQDGILSPTRLVELNSSLWNVDRASLAAADLDFELVRSHSGQQMMAEGWIPLRRRSDGAIVVATSRIPEPLLADKLADVLGAKIVLEVTTLWELKQVVLDAFRGEIAEQAATELWARAPELSARRVLSRVQTIGLFIGIAIVVAAAVFWPIGVLIALLTIASLVFFVSTAFKFFTALRGARFDVVERVSRRQVELLQDEELPVYTVLVPVFREANIVAQLVENLGGLDYPSHKLEILVLIEEIDTETLEAFKSADAPENFRVILIPKGQPQTKPRACNVGMYFASGEYVVIYDAEDSPDPDQLKKALVVFRRGGEKMVCVQAALNYFNANENFLTRMFTLEYSYWFDYMLPGLDAADLPIPLGGTSNHFRSEALRGLGSWDPFNVTEDADLGIRASALGYRVGVVNSTTMEEANTSVPNFIRQRSRWIKGYMQTALVHARAPLPLIRQIGMKRFTSFALLIAGTPATFLCVIPFYVLTLVTFLLPSEWTGQFFPVWLLWLCLLNFIVGSSVMVYLSMMGTFKRGTFDLIAWALLNPVYWVLHSYASYKALWQLIVKPHYWEKTEHGLSAQTAGHHDG